MSHGEQTLPGGRPAAPVERPAVRVLRTEVWLVLGLGLGASALYAVIDLLADLTRPGSLSAQVATLNGSTSPRPYVDLARQLLGVGLGLLPAALAVHLLGRTGRRIGGLDRRRPGLDALRGAVLAAVIGGSGLALYLAAHAVNGALTVVPENLPTVWWRVPVLLLSATQNAIGEEVVVVGYLLTRSEDLGWSRRRGLLASAVLRGSYHLYQGFGAFLGNAVMGVIFVRLYQRWGRVMPLIVAHALIDSVAFVGYALLAGKVGWIPTP